MKQEPDRQPLGPGVSMLIVSLYVLNIGACVWAVFKAVEVLSALPAAVHP